MKSRLSGRSEWSNEELEKAIDVLLASSIWLSDVPPGTEVPDWVISEVPVTRDRVSRAWDLLNLPPSTHKTEPEPLRYRKSKPDQPGIWAWRYDTSENLTPVQVVYLNQNDCDNASCNQIEWCYIGPLPQILPPVKKVVQRLWINHDQFRAHCGRDLVNYQWVNEGQPVIEGWTRTDETREVEQ